MSAKQTQAEQSNNVAALQRWTIAHAELVRARRTVERAFARMVRDESDALLAVRAKGGAVIVGLLDGQRWAVEDYRGSGLLTAAPVVEGGDVIEEESTRT